MDLKPYIYDLVERELFQRGFRDGEVKVSVDHYREGYAKLNIVRVLFRRRGDSNTFTVEFEIREGEDIRSYVMEAVSRFVAGRRFTDASMKYYDRFSVGPRSIPVSGVDWSFNFDTGREVREEDTPRKPKEPTFKQLMDSFKKQDLSKQEILKKLKGE